LTFRSESVTGKDQVVLRFPWLQCLVAVLMGLVTLPAGPAAAQQDTAAPSTGPLPAIIYPSPSRTAKPARQDVAPRPVASDSDCPVDDDCQIPYVIVGGFRGYWDRNRHFHRVSAAGIRAARPRAVAYHAAAFARTGSFRGGRAHR
jgi:hypothetical protein